MRPTNLGPLLLCALLVLHAATSCGAEDLDTRLVRAQERVRQGDLSGALDELEPLLVKTELDAAAKDRAREMVAAVLAARGEEHFRHARIPESLADFDRQLRLQPRQAAAHWQRGIALYYAGEYDQGARQFELHQTVNPEDVENAAWHFLCVVRAPNGSVEAARKKLIKVTHDPRVPMAQVQQLFAGTLQPEDVLRTSQSADDRAMFYANLYVGLYYEALGRTSESLRYMTLAADDPSAKNSYMGDVARVHVVLRKKGGLSSGDATSKPTSPRSPEK